MARMIFNPVSPVMSVMTLVSCTFIWVSAFCLRWVWRALLNADVTPSRHLAQRADGGIRAMRFAEPSKAVQWLQPLTVEHVGFACLEVAHALGIDPPHLEAARLPPLVERDPVALALGQWLA